VGYFRDPEDQRANGKLPRRKHYPEAGGRKPGAGGISFATGILAPDSVLMSNCARGVSSFFRLPFIKPDEAAVVVFGN